MRIFQVDAFTHTRFTGNPATVVLDADGRDDATLAAIAREFSHAETAFVCAATGPDHDCRLRFFNARKEAPFVGHATIAAHAVLLALDRRGLGVSRQHSGTGLIEVAARLSPAATANSAHSPVSPGSPDPLIEFRQTLPQFDAPLPLKTTLRVAEALRLPATLLHESMPARVARKGSTRLLVPVGDPRTLDTLAPNVDTLLSLGNELGADGFFVFAVSQREATLAHAAALTHEAELTHPEATLTTDSRMFCPALGIPEDPVSGNAHSMLAAYLWDVGQLDKDSAGFIGYQGRHMNRPGEVGVRLEINGSGLTAVHIGGSAVIVSEGTLTL